MNAVTTPGEAAPRKKKAELVKILLSLLFTALHAFWAPAVFLWLWRWFVVPLGVRDITYWHGVGLLLVVGYLKAPGHEDTRDRDADYYRQYVSGQFLLSAGILGVGWLVHLAVR